METEALNRDPTLASRYLADQLPESERAAFEAAMADDPAVLQELEATARLKVGLQYLRSRGELDGLLHEPPRRPVVWIALAAAVVGLIVGIALWRPILKPAGRPLLAAALSGLIDEAGRQLPLSATHAVVRTRAGTSTRIELPLERSAIELRIFPDLPTAPANYRASLALLSGNETGRPAVAIRGLVPDHEGFVHVFVDSGRLGPGRYRLVLSGEPASSDDSATFELNVVSRATR